MKKKLLAFTLAFLSLAAVTFGLLYDIRFLVSMTTGTTYKYLWLGLAFLLVAFSLIHFAWLLVPKKEVKK
jgi:hypothetical protein